MINLINKKIIIYFSIALILSLIFFLSLFPSSYYRYLFNRINISKIDNNSIDANLSFLTHKMIQYDLDNKITSKEIANKAFSNTNYFFNQVVKDCKFEQEQTISDITNYISCANKKLGEYFYYQPSREVSNNYANQRSDCDLNTYLLLDVARLVGIDAYIIYSPHHAFLAVKSKNHKVILWETTDNNNKGEKIDFTNKDFSNLDTNELNVDFASSFYKENNRIPYYRYYNGVDPFNLYKILVSDVPKINSSDLLDNSKVDYSNLIEDSYLKNPENVIIEDAYIDLLVQENRINDDIVRDIENSLKTDVTNQVKHISLAIFYKNKRMFDKAGEHVKTLLKSNLCDKDCIDLVIELKLENNLYLLQKYVDFHNSSLVKDLKEFLGLKDVYYTYEDYKKVRINFAWYLLDILMIILCWYVLISIPKLKKLIIRK